MTDRVKASKGIRIDRIDLMLVCAILVVMGSYALGYKLDWSQLDGKPAETTTAAEVDESANESPLVPNEAPAAPPAELVPAPAPPPAAPQASRAPAPVVSPAAPAPPALAPDPNQLAFDEMTGELQKLADHHQGRLAIYIKDFKSGREWSYHPDDLFPSASTVKLPIMACVFAKIKDGGLGLNTRLTLRRHNRVGGSGSLKWMPDGSRFTVAELLQHMISESDNTATNMILEALGMGYVQEEFARLGLLYTGIYADGMSLRGGHVAHENYTTAREMTMLMDKIYHGQLVDEQSSELMLEILKMKRPASRLAKGLPQGWEIAHKTGLLRHACHDVAIFLTPHGDYAMTVLTGSNDSYKGAKDFITRLGRVTFIHYGGYPYVAARGHHRQIAAAR